MKIIEINTTNFGSTGNIMLGIAEIARKMGHEVIVCFPASRDNRRLINVPHILIGNRLLRNTHRVLGTLTGFQDCFSIISTWRFIHKLKIEKPTVLHLHNLHDCYINLKMLFNYIRREEIPTVWTLHDCWAMTGHCPHFSMAKCEKWKTGCNNCTSFRGYPKTLFDNSRTMWRMKKKWFTRVDNMTIVTPSRWLADLVQQSFLKEYPIQVIHNGINLDIFKPTASDFREKHGIDKDKRLLLGVSFGWGQRKGLDVFIELAKRLDEQYQIVLVGTNEETDKLLPDNIISIHRTDNQRQLAEIYTAADVFVNPTREETLGLVNIEALACGTPVITFDTGGSPECIDETSGRVITCNDIDTLTKEIIHVCETQHISKEACIRQAKKFDQYDKFSEYINLYMETNQ